MISYPIALRLVLLFKLLMFLGLWGLELNYGNRADERVGLFFYGKDAHSYLDPVENLIDGGFYGMVENEPSAFRMPSMVMFYGPFYAFFGKEIGLLSLVLVNLCLELLSCLFLYKLARDLYSEKIALVVLVLYCLYPRITSFGYLGMTESLAASFIVFFIWSIHKYFHARKFKYLILSSFSLSTLIFLKPVSGVFWPVVLVFLFIFEFKRANSSHILFLKRAIIFSSFIIISLSVWTVRNYYAFKEIIPLTSAFDEKGPNSKFKEFCRATGLEFQAWSGRDIQAWFVPPWNPIFDNDFQDSDPFSPRIFTKNLNLDTLKEIRRNWHISLDESVNLNQRIEFSRKTEKSFDRAIRSYKESESYAEYCISRFILLERFLLIRDSFSPFSQSNTFFMALRVWYFLSYYLIILFGVLGMMFLLLSARIMELMLSMLVLIFVVVHIHLGIIENRYILPIFPILAFSCGSVLSYTEELYETYKRRKHPK